MTTTSGKVVKGGVRAGALSPKAGRGRRSQDGKSVNAYKRQPQPSKWVCSRCPQVEMKDRKKGEPRTERISFETRASLTRHRENHHR